MVVAKDSLPWLHFAPDRKFIISIKVLDTIYDQHIIIWFLLHFEFCILDKFKVTYIAGVMR